MSAYTTVQQRLPGSYDLGELSERKQQLVDEMSEFTKEGDRVNPTESHLRLAEELVRTDDRTRYVKIPFGNIVDRNQASDLKVILLNEALQVPYMIVLFYNGYL